MWNRALSAGEAELDYKGGDSGVILNSNSTVKLNTGSLKKGLVLDMPLREVDNKVGDEQITLSNNRNFEGGTIGGWTYNSPDSGTGTVTYVADSPVAGDKVGKLLTTHAQYSRAALQHTSMTALVAGKTYRFSMDVYLLASHNFDAVGIGASQFTDSTTTAENPLDLTKTNQWQRVTVLFTPDTDVAGYFYLQTYGESFAADTEFVYFDNISLKPVETADLTPNSNHGVVYGATQNTSDITFGGSDYITPGDVLNQTTNDFSVAFKVTTTDNGTQRLVAKEENTVNPHWYVGIESGKVIGSLYDTARAYSTGDGTSVDDGVEHSVVVVFDRSGNLIRYVDGVQTGTEDNISARSATLTNAQNLVIAGRWKAGAPDNFFTGTLKDVKIYNRALTTDEIERLYKQGLSD
jgi:hypothetical protein